MQPVLLAHMRNGIRRHRIQHQHQIANSAGHRPIWVKFQNRSGANSWGMGPGVDLRPSTPQQLAGRRRDPAPSVANLNRPKPEATATADTPLGPLDKYSATRGLPLTPERMLSVNTDPANSGTVILPRRTTPASCIRSAQTGSRDRTFPCISGDPNAVSTPAVSIRSLTVDGMPSKRPISHPDRKSRLAALAAASAPSRSTNANGFSSPLNRSICASVPSTTSRKEKYRPEEAATTPPRSKASVQFDPASLCSR